MQAEWLKIRKQGKTYFMNMSLASISHQSQGQNIAALTLHFPNIETALSPSC
jgi:hypothetical protein